MNWYYVDASGKQAGPVDDAKLEELVSNSTIHQETLVWQEGMANWQAYSDVRPHPPAPAPAPPVIPPIVPEANEAVCVECGRIFSKDNMIRHGEAHVCAECKPIFIQKLSEGLATGARRGRRSLPVNADALINEITSKAYDVDIGSCVTRGWNLVKSNLGLSVGAVFLVLACNQAAGLLPFVGFIITFMLHGPLFGGLNNFFLKLIRGESQGLGDAFSGFSKNFWRLCGTGVLMMLSLYVWFIPAVVTFVASGRFAEPGPPNFGPFIVLLLLGLLVVVYVSVSLVFALPLCVDLELGPVDALRVSWRVVSKKWFSMFGLVLVAGLLSMLGLIACIVGILVTLPIFYAAILYAYEDIFGVPEF